MTLNTKIAILYGENVESSSSMLMFFCQSRLLHSTTEWKSPTEAPKFPFSSTTRAIILSAFSKSWKCLYNACFGHLHFLYVFWERLFAIVWHPSGKWSVVIKHFIRQERQKLMLGGSIYAAKRMVIGIHVVSRSASVNAMHSD